MSEILQSTAAHGAPGAAAGPAPEVSVLIVSYNTCMMTLECLRTLEDALPGIDAEVIVIDNASKDGSPDAIQLAYPWVRVVASETNLGFGAANNLAMKMARGEYFLLLNSDAFPEPSAVGVLLQYLKKYPRAGVVGPRLLNADGSLQVSCFPFPTPLLAWMENLWLTRGYRSWAHDRVRHVDFLVGACLLVRREVHDEVGGFDEKFFMYSEEADWQRRMKNTGWGAVFVPDARVKHLGGASGAKEEAKVSRYFFESLDYYERKHHGLLGLIAFRLAMVVGCGLRMCLWMAMSVIPARRKLALAKAKKHSRLCIRQAFCWGKTAA